MRPYWSPRITILILNDFFNVSLCLVDARRALADPGSTNAKHAVSKMLQTGSEALYPFAPHAKMKKENLALEDVG